MRDKCDTYPNVFTKFTCSYPNIFWLLVTNVVSEMLCQRPNVILKITSLPYPPFFFKLKKVILLHDTCIWHWELLCKETAKQHITASCIIQNKDFHSWQEMLKSWAETNKGVTMKLNDVGKWGIQINRWC